jgi:hypothetical protein
MHLRTRCRIAVTCTSVHAPPRAVGIPRAHDLALVLLDGRQDMDEPPSASAQVILDCLAVALEAEASPTLPVRADRQSVFVCRARLRPEYKVTITSILGVCKLGMHCRPGATFCSTIAVARLCELNDDARVGPRKSSARSSAQSRSQGLFAHDRRPRSERARRLASRAQRLRPARRLAARLFPCLLNYRSSLPRSAPRVRQSDCEHHQASSCHPDLQRYRAGAPQWRALRRRRTLGPAACAAHRPVRRGEPAGRLERVAHLCAVSVRSAAAAIDSTAATHVREIAMIILLWDGTRRMG